jgi:signal peptidase I
MREPTFHRGDMVVVQHYTREGAKYSWVAEVVATTFPLGQEITTVTYDSGRERDYKVQDLYLATPSHLNPYDAEEFHEYV